MEPGCRAAEADAIPELRRFVVSDGVRVAMTESLADAISELSGLAAPEPGAPTAMPTLDAPAGGDAPRPSTALGRLARAEARARAGDWQGYGEALDELRALLQRLGSR